MTFTTGLVALTTDLVDFLVSGALTSSTLIDLADFNLVKLRDVLVTSALLVGCLFNVFDLDNVFCFFRVLGLILLSVRVILPDSYVMPGSILGVAELCLDFTFKIPFDFLFSPAEFYLD